MDSIARGQDVRMSCSFADEHGTDCKRPNASVDKFFRWFGECLHNGGDHDLKPEVVQNSRYPLG